MLIIYTGVINSATVEYDTTSFTTLQFASGKTAKIYNSQDSYNHLFYLAKDAVNNGKVASVMYDSTTLNVQSIQYPAKV